MPMGPQPKRPFAAQLNGPEGPKAHPSQQNAAPDALPKPTLGSRSHKGKRKHHCRHYITLNEVTLENSLSFIHCGHFYSAPSSPLLLRGAPDYSTDTVSEFHAETHRQL